MNLRTTLAIVVFSAVVVFTACSRRDASRTSTAGAIGANSAATNATTRLFDRRNLNVTGFNNLTEFIRADVRERLDQEPIGGEEGFVPPPSLTENPDESRADSEQPDPANSEDSGAKELEIEKVKFSWAKKKFGDALASDPNATGMIVLYADENYYDIGRLTNFVEDGRDRIAANSGVDIARLQVVFGGYRGVAQVEFWLVPAGENMPEIRPEQRDAPGDTEN